MTIQVDAVGVILCHFTMDVPVRVVKVYDDWLRKGHIDATVLRDVAPCYKKGVTYTFSGGFLKDHLPREPGKFAKRMGT